MAAETQSSALRGHPPWWAVWSVLIVLNVACHFSFLFLQAHAEVGDFAANALQIRHAKSFQELYGNYSRWGFHHPGPAFFYLYALGEWIFADFLRVVPSPFNAHILTGIFIQCGFFTWTLRIAQKHFRELFLLPVMLLFATLHFGLVSFYGQDSIFGSIWPPYVLLFPFLCFLLACASLAAGDGWDLIPAALAGCMLVHGHVAQPLFVIPCFVLALLAFLKRAGKEAGSLLAALSRAKIPLLIALGIVLVALVPIAIDAAGWEQSNLRALLQHFSSHGSDRKSAGSAFLYLSSFFCYLADPENYCDRLNAARFHFLTERWFFAAAWGAIIVVVLLLVRPLLRANSFVRWLCAYFGLATLLTLCWAMMQNGPMYNFNSFFNFGLAFILLMLLAMVLCARIPFPRGQLAANSLSLIALLLFVPVARSWRLHLDLATIAYRPNLSSDLESFARADGNRAKFLLFPHSEWPNAIGVALALDRLRIDYAVTPEWGFIFGRRHVRPLEEARGSKGVSVWQFERAEKAAPGFKLNDGKFIMVATPGDIGE